MRGEMKLTYKTFLLNGETSDTNDNVKNKINTKHIQPNNDMTDTLGEHVNMRVVLVLLVLVLFLLSHSFLSHIAWLKMSECSSHLIHA